MKSRKTLFGYVPDDWIVTSIGEIADLRQGLQISTKLRINDAKAGYIPLLKIVDLSTRVFTDYVTNIKEQYIATEKDIIYTRTGQVGLVYTDLNGCVHNNCFKVIVDYSKFDKYYIYYYLKSNPVFRYSNSVASGSVQKDLRHSDFKSCIIGYPPLNEQKAIAHILSTLDDKIETNNQINRKLEEMAQTIFKHWFVDFEFPNEDGEPYKSSGGEMVESELGMIPKGWEVSTVGNLTEVVSKGTTPRKVDINNVTDDNNVRFLKVKDIGDDGIIDLTSLEMIPSSIHLNQLKRSVLKYKDILISIAGTIGRVSYVSDELIDANINQAIAFVRLKDIDKYFLLVFHKFKSDEFQDSIRSKIVQGVQANISLSVLKSEKIILPDDNLLQLYNDTLNCFFQKKSILYKETNSLTQLRDTLIPKLMSGEIRVPLEDEESSN